VNCSLTCTLTYQSQICEAYNLPNCKEDGIIHITISSNLSHHDTQPVPGCLHLPIDLVKTANSSKVKPFCQDKTVVQCEASCHDENMKQFIRKDWIFSSFNFWVFFLLNIVSYSSFGVATSMGDALCFELLEGKFEDYGAQRVWGSVGWGIFTVVSGYLIDTQSSSHSKDYTPAFLLMAGLLCVDIIISSRLKLNSSMNSTSNFNVMWQLLTRPRVCIFVLWCAAVGILTSVVWQWLLWFLQDLASAKSEDVLNCESIKGPDWVTLLLGLNMGIQCWIGEVPMFFLSGWVIKSLGHSNTMTLVLGAFGIRFILYSYITNPWYSLPIEILNGVTFGLFYSTMASYAHIISPPGFESTVQGIVGAAFEGLGVAVGSVVGGAVYSAMGGVFMFRSFGLFAIVLCLIHAIVHIVLKCYIEKKKTSDFDVVATEDQDRPKVIQENERSRGLLTDT